MSVTREAVTTPGASTETTGTTEATSPAPSPRAWLPWAGVGLITAALLVSWWPTLRIALANGHDGTLMGAVLMRSQNFWEQGLVGSSFVSDTGPYMGDYAHHPPLQNFLAAGWTGIVGYGESAIRSLYFVIGAATVPAGALLLRSLRVRWAAVFLALGALVAADMFWVFGRFHAGVALPLALAAAMVELGRRREPPRWLLAVGAVVGFVTMMHSWPAALAGGLLGLWLLVQRRAIDRVVVVMGVAMVTGLGLAVAWVWGISGTGALVNQAEFRTAGGGFTTGEWISQQLHHARELFPIWYLALFVPAVATGLWQQRTRVVTGVFLVTAVVWTAALPNGSFVHDYWNFWFLPAGLVGMAVLADRILGRLPTREMYAAAGVMGLLLLVAFVSLATGPKDDRYFEAGADAGVLARDFAPVVAQDTGWVAGHIGAPRWLSWYWDVPARKITPELVAERPPGELVLVRLSGGSEPPEWFPPDLADRALAVRGQYAVVQVGALR